MEAQKQSLQKNGKNLHILSLHWNNVAAIKKLYESFNYHDYKWWIRDNGSTDGSSKYLDSITNDKISIYYAGHNRDSFAKGMNSLYDIAKPGDDDYILLLNDDLYFSDDNSIEKMIDCLSDDVGIVGCRLLYPDSNRLQHAGVFFPAEFGGLPWHYRHKEYADDESLETKEMPAVTGAMMLMRAGDFKAAGKFDERFVWSFEDIDLCMKVKELGKKIIYCGDTTVFHEESAGLKINPINKLMFSKNSRLFRAKWAKKLGF